jgi:hypothetical protein
MALTSRAVARSDDRDPHDPEARVGVRRADGDRGAVIVEAALVLPMLFFLVFGIIDFGVNLSDQIAVREGVREGVRQAVVDAPGATTIAEVVTLTEDRIGVEDDDAAVYVVPEATDVAAGLKGSNLTVCAYVPMRSLSGLYSSVLDDRYMWSKVTMRVEQDLSYDAPGGDPAPAGEDWTGCGAGA